MVAPDLVEGDTVQKVVQELTDRGVATLEVGADAYRSLSDRQNPQGIAVVARQSFSAIEDIDPNRGLCWVVLSRPQDAGNVGTILRTVDAVGGAGLILLDESVDPYDPKAVRASMGAIFTVTVVRADLASLSEWTEENGCQVVGASLDGSCRYWDLEYRRPTVLLMGSEPEGLNEAEISTCHDTVRIPMVGRSDSLNLGVATSLVLYEIFHQLVPETA